MAPRSPAPSGLAAEASRNGRPQSGSACLLRTLPPQCRPHSLGFVRVLRPWSSACGGHLPSSARIHATFKQLSGCSTQPRQRLSSRGPAESFNRARAGCPMVSYTNCSGGVGRAKSVVREQAIAQRHLPRILGRRGGRVVTVLGRRGLRRRRLAIDPPCGARG